MFLLKDLLLFSYLTVLVAGAAVKIPTKTPWTSSASKSGNIKYLIFYIYTHIHVYNIIRSNI